MSQNVQTKDQQVNTYFAENANKISEITENINKASTGQLLSSRFKAVLGWSASAVLDKLIHEFSKHGKQRQKVTNSHILNMIDKETCSERTLNRVLTKLHNMGLIIRETFRKRNKKGQIKSENYLSVNFKKVAEILGSHRPPLCRILRTTSLSSLQEEKRSDRKAISLGEADLSVQAEISPAKNPDGPSTSNVVEFKLTKRMKQRALDAKLEADRVEEEYEACQEYYKGKKISPKAFTTRVWAAWVQRAIAWGRKSRKKKEGAHLMARKVQTRQIELKIESPIPEEDVLRIQTHLASIKDERSVYVVDNLAENEKDDYSTWYRYKVYVPHSQCAQFRAENKTALYQARLKALPLPDDNPYFLKLAS